MMRAGLTMLLAAALWLGGCATVPHAPVPPPIDPPSAADVHDAVRRGVAFLIATQNANGSWGSPTRTKDLNILAPVPGGHEAYRAAVTAMCISALIETGQGQVGVDAALDKAQAWLIVHLPKVKRSSMSVLYNVWAHAYSIQALVRLIEYRRDSTPAMRKILSDLVDSQIERLGRYQFIEGGWGYYDFYSHTQHPSGMAMSFTTSTVLIALAEARASGFNVPQKMVDNGVAQVHFQQKPDHSYLYASTHWGRPMHPVNRPVGSLGRSQVCNAALRLWGDKNVTDSVLRDWLNRIFARNGFLSHGRKRPIPHEAPFYIAGYFYYYGMYYAAYCIELLPPDARLFYQQQMARNMVDLQEKDGSWWDYPLYNYHQQYGTAFALMTLARCEAPPIGGER